MDALTTFEEHRPYLFGVAYRMLGTVSDAQDVLQDAWLRWSDRMNRGDHVQKPRSFLTSVVTRLAIDRLRQEKARREQYVGQWLPEPLVIDEHTPGDHAELAESLRIAFLLVLERLSPVERAVFLLREVFDYEYDEITQIVGKNEPNCRQIFARARKHMDENRSRVEIKPDEENRIANAFFAALRRGDIKAVESLLASDVTAYGDGGGKAPAAARPIIGLPAVARFLTGLLRLAPPDLEIERVTINAMPGILARSAGKVFSAMSLEIVDGQVKAIRSVINPDKLAHLNH